jgi:hypothetical protein
MAIDVQLDYSNLVYYLSVLFVKPRYCTRVYSNAFKIMFLCDAGIYKAVR